MEIKRKTVRKAIGAARAGAGGASTIVVGANEYTAENGRVELPQYVEKVNDGITDRLPDASGRVTLPIIPRSVSVNGSTYTPDAAGDVDLGTIGGVCVGVGSVKFNGSTYTPDANGVVDIGAAYTRVVYNNATQFASNFPWATFPNAPETSTLNRIQGVTQKRWMVITSGNVSDAVSSIVTISLGGSATVAPSLLQVVVSMSLSASDANMTTAVTPLSGFGTLRCWAVREQTKLVLIVDTGVSTPYGVCTSTTSLFKDESWAYYGTLAGTDDTPDSITIDSTTMPRTAALLLYLSTAADAADYRYIRRVSLEGGLSNTPVTNIQITTSQRLNDIV